MSDLILRSWNNKSIRQRADGFISLTDMCSASGKNFADWNRLKSTEEYLKVLVAKRYGNSHNGPIEVNQGGISENQGTWGDRRVALRMAQWISAEFALQVDEWVEELLLTGSVNIGDEPKAKPAAAPQTLPERVATVDLMLSCLDRVGISLENPRFKQGIQDMTGNILGLSQEALPGTAERWYGVAERARQLGHPISLVEKHKSQLGKAVKKVMPETDRRMEERLCGGTQQPICIYRLSEALDTAIREFFAIKAVA